MLALCETVECRRVQLLGYFGQSLERVRQLRHLPRRRRSRGTARCPRRSCCRRWCGCGARSNQRFGAGHLIDVLLGRDTERVRQHGHDELTTYGIGTELSEQEWRGVVRQLLAQGLLAVNTDGYGTLVDHRRVGRGAERRRAR